MGKALIARKQEVETLEKIVNSSKSEFVAVYGRRRVGKTFLIRQFFNNRFDFYLSGIANCGIKEQLRAFNKALAKYGYDKKASNWFDAFDYLAELLSGEPEEKKIVFIDEMPWLDTPKSNFIQALEHFWNSWASAQDNIKFIVCGSSTSWITSKLINGKGGLHNRLTNRIELLPFTLDDCKEYFKARKFPFQARQIAQCYMIMGGIPFYLDYLDPQIPFSKNIDQLFFRANGLMRTEFDNLYSALFKNSDDYITIVEALATKRKGLTRKEITVATRKTTSGGLSKILANLEMCGFIRSYYAYGKINRDKLYQLIDPYSLFYFNFIKNRQATDEDYWTLSINTSEVDSWFGYAFEILCLNHIQKIKNVLGISGIRTSVYSWNYQPDSGNGAQIDLILDRADGFMNICEIKFSRDKYVITKAYNEKMSQNINAFMAQTKTSKAPIFTMITSNGVKQNANYDIVQKEICLDEIL